MRIKEVEFKTRWLDKVARFYKEKLGLELIEKSERRCIFKAGWSRLIFVTDDSGDAPWYHFAFHIPLSMFEQSMLWVESFTPLLQNRDMKHFSFPYWKAEAFFFEDPSGNLIEIIGREDFEISDADDAACDLIAGIGEVGIPVVEFDANDRSLRRQLGMGYTLDPTGSFAPIGDTEGTLMLVREGRPWFPTKREAEIHPLRIVLSGPQRAHVTFAAEPYLIEMEQNG